MTLPAWYVRNASRSGRRRAPPCERRRRPQSRSRTTPRRGGRPWNRYPEETRPTRKSRSRPRQASAAHLVEIPVPTRPAHPLGLLDAQGFRGKLPQREVDRLALRSQLVTAHDLGASLIVDIHVGAGHTPTIRQTSGQGQWFCPRTPWSEEFSARSSPRRPLSRRPPPPAFSSMPSNTAIMLPASRPPVRFFRRRIERGMTTDAVTMLLAAAALAVQQWRGRQATLRSLGELRKSMARLETLLATAAKARQTT